MTSTLLHRTQDAKPARARRKSVMRVSRDSSVVYTTGNRKRLVDSFNRWQRTKAFHKISEAGGLCAVDVLRQSRDDGYF